MSDHDLDAGDPEQSTQAPGDPATDTAPDGEPVQQTFDIDGDGRLDVLLTRFADGAWTTLSDENADGAAETFLADLDNDGVPELAVERLPDGSYVMSADTDGDGVYDQTETVTREQLEARAPGVVAYLDTHFGPADGVADPGTEPEFDPGTGDDLVVDGQLVGDPVGDSEHWFNQARNGFCVPASIAQIVSEYSGVHFADESAFVELANEQGLFTVGMDGVPGMTPDNALTLLESAGVPADLQVGTTDDLVQYLGDGRRILLFVDSGEIWDGEPVEDDRYDHAVVLTGIDVERGVAILSDPGSPDGNLEEVPLAVFEDAWADSDHTMIVCDEPPTGQPATDQPPTGQPPTGQPPTGQPPTGQPPTDQPADGDVPAGATERATSWLVQQPWVLLPVSVATEAAAADQA